MRDTLEGSLGGNPYFRTGLLGYNSAERRYEYVTADNMTPILMNYRSAPDRSPAWPIEMLGAFTDLGVTGEANVGRELAMRTVIELDGDRHTFRLYFSVPAAASSGPTR